MKFLPDKFRWDRVSEPYIDSFIRIEKWRSLLVDKETQSVLGERVTYMRHFGWMNRLSPAPNIGETCRDLEAERGREELFRKEREEEQAFFGSILRPEALNR